MRVTGSAILAAGLMLSGCEGAMSGLSSTNQDVYSAPGYYGTPTYAAPGYYNGPGYAAPYPYQPGYASPYTYAPGWRDRDAWREHEQRERRDHAYENDGRSNGHAYQGARPTPPISAQPHGFAPAASPPAAPVRPPPAPPPSAHQNQRLLDQLGFQPSR